MDCNTLEHNTNISYTHPLYYGTEISLDEAPQYDCFRLLLIEEGSGIICFEDCSINFTAPALFCINEKDSPIFKDCSETKINNIYFYPKLINPLFNYNNIRDNKDSFSDVEQQDCYLLLPFIHRDDHFKGLFIFEPSTLTKISSLFDFIVKELQEKRDGYWPCRSRSYLLELLILTTKLFDSIHNTLDNKSNDTPKYITNVITYLHNNYKEKITLEILSTMFTTNRTTLNNQFFKTTNLSIIDYLIKLRVNLASTMLRDTLIPIAEIMNRVGFNDNAHFWRTFKKHTSLSPKEYREKYCWIKD
ncbi:MAG: hypothetical protein K0R15_303 [Clostridiales bacterium]|jgi:AraC family L-rhamnose operon regulatory protein RhaS|nr:hypothetical protein [Clostridiales bacterium]